MNRSDGAITYEQWLHQRVANPTMACGPTVVDDRPWWQYLPGLNPYANLERQARQAGRQTDKEAGQ